jgi:hypothetical protein
VSAATWIASPPEGRRCAGSGWTGFDRQGAQGDFVSDDGSLIRRDVGVAPGADLSRVGDLVPAEDTGHPYLVYPQAGSWDWLLITVLGMASVIVLAVWAWSAGRAIRRGWA